MLGVNQPSRSSTLPSIPLLQEALRKLWLKSVAGSISNPDVLAISPLRIYLTPLAIFVFLTPCAKYIHIRCIAFLLFVAFQMDFLYILRLSSPWLVLLNDLVRHPWVSFSHEQMGIPTA